MKFRAELLQSAVLTLCLTAAARGPRGETASPGACGLITRQEAARALDTPVPAGIDKAADIPMQGASVKAQYCFYGSEVSLARFDLGPNAASLFEQYRTSLTSDSDYQSVSGVGDAAFVAKGQLAIRKGSTGLIVDVGQARGGGEKERKAEKALALLALGRM